MVLGSHTLLKTRQCAGVGLAVAGIVLLVAGKDGGASLAGVRAGDLLSLGAAAVFALYGIVTKPLCERYPASTVLAGSLLVGSVPLLPLALLETPPQSWTAVTVDGWAIWLYSVVVPVYLGYTWWTAAIAARGVGAVAPYVLLVPVVGGLAAVAGLREAFTPLDAIGAVLTVAVLALGRGWLPRLGSLRARRPQTARR